LNPSYDSAETRTLPAMARDFSGPGENETILNNHTRPNRKRLGDSIGAPLGRTEHTSQEWSREERHQEHHPVHAVKDQNIVQSPVARYRSEPSE